MADCFGYKCDCYGIRVIVMCIWMIVLGISVIGIGINVIGMGIMIGIHWYRYKCDWYGYECDWYGYKCLELHFGPRCLQRKSFLQMQNRVSNIIGHHTNTKMTSSTATLLYCRPSKYVIIRCATNYTHQNITIFVQQQDR